jgi:DNA-binding transcriptional LysR family regulator
VDVHLSEGDPHELARALADRDLDLAVVFAWPGREIGLDYAQRFVCADDQIETAPLFEDPYVVVAPDDHRLAGHDEVTLDELADEFIIGSRFTPGLDQVIAHFADRRRGPLFTGHALPDYQSVRALAAAGDGLGVIPRLAAVNALAGTVTLPIADPAPYRSVLLAEPADAVRSSAAAAMIAVLQL